jgi:hypothetical protein
MKPAFPDLPPDSDPNILARAHRVVTAWSRDRSREEIVAMLVEVRGDLLRARPVRNWCPATRWLSR